MEKDGIIIKSSFLDDEGQYLLIELGGYIDQANSHHLQREISEALKAEIYNIIFDLKDLTYMSSAGWGILIGEIKRFREKGGDVKLANMPLNIYEVYQMLEFYHILQDYPSVQDAYKSFTGRKLREEEARVGKNDKRGSVPKEDSVNAIETTLTPPSKNGDEESGEVVEQFSMDLSDIMEEVEQIPSRNNRSLRRIEFIPVALEETANVTSLPIPEKIKRVVAKRPSAGLFEIRRILRHDEFGNTKIGLFRLWKYLKELDLNTPEKRYRYYRSC